MYVSGFHFLSNSCTEQQRHSLRGWLINVLPDYLQLYCNRVCVCIVVVLVMQDSCLPRAPAELERCTAARDCICALQLYRLLFCQPTYSTRWVSGYIFSSLGKRLSTCLKREIHGWKWQQICEKKSSTFWKVLLWNSRKILQIFRKYIKCKNMLSFHTLYFPLYPPCNSAQYTRLQASIVSDTRYECQ